MNSTLLAGHGIRLYNLFPRLVGSMTRWQEQLPRIKNMGFNAVWVNPFHFPGFSGSLYSPKNFFQFNPLFIDSSSPLPPREQLKQAIEATHRHGMLFLMDLVINHTAIDCDLIEEHPDWFKREPDGGIVHPGAMHDGVWHEWGDLAEVNNESSVDRANLWQFWWNMMQSYLELGVDGFRCDMAYQVPADLWRFLIDKARSTTTGCLFIAESLGCSFQQVVELAQLGFDYLFNSVKYWDFNEPWGMEQYNRTSPLVGSIAFPESHDTTRLAADEDGDLAAIKRQLLFSATFSQGYMIPLGFEFGFRTSMNVVKTDPTWWETTTIDLSDYIRQVNVIKASYPVLNREQGLSVVDQGNWTNVFCFKRSAPNEKTILILLNKDKHTYQRVYFDNIFKILESDQIIDLSPDYPLPSISTQFEYWLRPAQVKILAAS